MGKTSKFIAIMKFAALLMGAYLITATIHEGGHILDLRSQNVSINQVCLLGWDRSMADKIDYPSGSAWVSPNSTYNKTFSLWWDCEFLSIGDNSECYEYYGEDKP